MPLLSPLFALLVALGSPQPSGEGAVARATDSPAAAVTDRELLSSRAAVWPGFVTFDRHPVARQIRIERRVILRINPQPSDLRRGMVAQLPEQGAPRRFAERPYGKCVDAADIVGVSSRESRLVMYMRDRKILTAELEKACSPRDFYLGFYIERNEDGRLCVDRDRLMSRAGAKCRVARLNRLVAVGE